MKLYRGPLRRRRSTKPVVFIFKSTMELEHDNEINYSSENNYKMKGSTPINVLQAETTEMSQQNVQQND